MNKPSAPLRVLIVEDEAIIAMDLGMIIEDAGHEVVGVAASLRDVQDLDDSLVPQLAFVDLQLADGSNGVDVSAHIQRHWADAIIVFVTANPKKLPADKAGAHAVISKPFSRSGFMSAMRYLTEGVCDPPPTSPLPSGFTAFPKLEAGWAN